MSAGEWCGIDLDQPIGSNDGSVAGVRYFRSQPNHGMFAPEQYVHFETDSVVKPIHSRVRKYVVVICLVIMLILKFIGSATGLLQLSVPQWQPDVSLVDSDINVYCNSCTCRRIIIYL